uniref:Ig-like domain-containing protein n=1 Tax=Paramormyrops kingsleyae TaxID=1676925 RepID=A0A3B3SXG9_9TELE
MADKLPLLLLLLGLPSVICDGLESIPSNPVLQEPGTILSLSCKGSGFNFGSYGMHWIRQSAGKPLEWMGVIWYDASKTVYAKSVEGRIEITRDNGNSMVYLKLSALKAEDTSVYYCAGYTVSHVCGLAVQKDHGLLKSTQQISDILETL